MVGRRVSGTTAVSSSRLVSRNKTRMITTATITTTKITTPIIIIFFFSDKSILSATTTSGSSTIVALITGELDALAVKGLFLLGKSEPREPTPSSVLSARRKTPAVDAADCPELFGEFSFCCVVEAAELRLLRRRREFSSRVRCLAAKWKNLMFRLGAGSWTCIAPMSSLKLEPSFRVQAAAMAPLSSFPAADPAASPSEWEMRTQSSSTTLGRPKPASESSMRSASSDPLVCSPKELKYSMASSTTIFDSAIARARMAH
mmetsp:Transcript_7340/g.15368  ORF Transcript_7340/g.15368 Transcript_7340/m.15368 type:complete len:260 (+) Transcript_7340:1740-2519(+)